MPITLLFCSIRISLIRAFRYRFDFVMSLMEGLSMLAINLVFFSTSGRLIGGTQMPSIFLLVSLFQIFIGLFYGLFIDNITGLKYYINRGDLDWMLMKPVSSQFYLSIRFINFGHIFSSLLTIPLLFYLSWYFGFEIKLMNVLVAGVYILIAVVDAYAFLTIATSVAIALTSSGNVSGFVLPFLTLGKYPRRMYRTVTPILIIFFPAVIVCDFAKDAWLGKWSLSQLFLHIAIMLLQVWLTSKVFRIACYNYKSSGS